VVDDQIKARRFASLMVPHLDAAYNLARWLMRNDHDAEDAVQESFLRALRFFDGFRGGDARVWLLTIVRHTCFTRLDKHRRRELEVPFEEDVHSGSGSEHNAGAVSAPDAQLLAAANQSMLNRAIESLSAAHREVLVLRELEELPYREIARVTGVPIGTVMSRLSEARRRLREAYGRVAEEG
jgi:RNA polymerase sigma-70 factor (ECF subfamily)